MSILRFNTGWLRRAIICAALATGTACSSDKTTDPGDTGAITLQSGTTQLSVAQGASGSAQLTIARLNDFTGEVTIAIQGLPSGVSIALSPSVLGAGVTSTTLNFVVDAATPLGTSTVTVRATGPGVDPVTATIQLTITQKPSISIAVASGTLSFAAGGQGSKTITISRNGGYTGAVTLALTGQGSTLTPTFAPNATTTSESIITLASTTAAPVGSATYVIHATGAGVDEATANLPVTITDAPGFSISLSTPSLSFQQARRGSSTVTITRMGGFTGAVALTVEGAPAASISTFSNAAPTGTTSTLNVDASPLLATGNYTLTVRGSAAGLPSSAVALPVTIQAGTGLGLTLTPATLDVPQGTTASFTANYTRFGGLTGFIGVGLIAGNDGTSSYGNTVGDVNQTTATLTIDYLANAALGPRTVTFQAFVIPAGTPADTASLIINVVPAVSPVFALQQTDPPNSVPSTGGTSQGKYSIFRAGGFTGAVTLSAANCSPGVSPNFPVTNVAGDTFVVNYTIAPGTSSGTKTCNINGAAAGTANRSILIGIVVQ